MFELIKIFREQTISMKKLVGQLVDFGYRRVESTMEPGDFSLRGGIVDVFPLRYENPVRVELESHTVVSLRSFSPLDGEIISLEEEVTLFPVKKTLKRVRRRMSDFFAGGRVPVESLADLEIGEYVVHLNHGIGIFRGMDTLELEGKEQDCLAIEYTYGDKLYVPLDQMYLVQRYVGFMGHKPRLYKLGTRKWLQVRKRAEEGVNRLAGELLEMAALRKSKQGFAFSSDGDWQKEFEKSFAYPETPDQTRTLQEVKLDMESGKIMDRLICGDVGYGKTEVALRAAFKAVLDNKQVAMLVPTTILAEQHCYTFTKRLEGYPINAQILSRFRSREEQKMILDDLARGAVDIVIGTHRLLSKDVRFKDLGLVIIDEEQRFGVRHKEKLKKLRAVADILTLTATPIPRTLYMSLLGAKEMSIINTPPQSRIPVETYVSEYDESLIKKAIEKELRREGQVYFVSYRVMGIENLAGSIRKLAPRARVEIGHGQMPEKELEKVMERFITGDVDVLVSTSIVESGLDIPNVNTIIVNRADTFGLADLYQLRGRVGRATARAYAYFLIPQGTVLTAETEKRLKSIEKFTDLGAGFEIAMKDLEIRGAGNLLGAEQHGYMQAVGFDLYCRLLRQVIHRLNLKE